MADGPEGKPPTEEGAPYADPVDEQVDESFPASDPPVGWAGEDPRDRVEGDGSPAAG